MVVRLDPLELDVDKVLRVKRTGQSLFWFDLLCFAFEIILVEKPTAQGTADGQKVSRPCGPFGCGCFRGVKPSLAGSDDSDESRVEGETYR